MTVSGLNPNMGSMDLEIILNGLRNELPKLISDLKRLELVSDLPRVAPEAAQLLLKAAEDSSSIKLEQEDGALIVSLIVGVNRQIFVEPHDGSTAAKWRHVVEELQHKRLIRQPDPDYEVFDLTYDGYEYADRLRSAEPHTP